MATILEQKRCETCGAVVLFDPKGELDAMFEARSRMVLETPPWGAVNVIPGSFYVGVDESARRPPGGIRTYIARRTYVEHVCVP